MYYIIVITDAQAIFRYDSLGEASEKFHTELAYAINQNISCTCVIMDKHGAVYRTEEYVRTVTPVTEE